MNRLRKHDLTRETPVLDEAVKDEFNCNLNNAAGTRLLKIGGGESSGGKLSCAC